jgi:DNA invertase Pin-like site-specific DNA recombinase
VYKEVSVKAGVYVRPSVAKDDERATEAAMERQEDDCRRLCKSRSWVVAKVYRDEGISAYQAGKRRPQFEEALEDLAAGRIDVLVVWKLDRLARRLRDLVRVEDAVEKSGGKLVTVQEGEQAQFMLRILAAMAEQESKNTSTRLKRQRLQAAERGEPNQGGRRPFGYTTLPRTIKDDEAAVVRELADRLLAGESVRSLTAWANTVSTATTGKPWSQRTLRGMLLSPALAGWRTYTGSRFEGRWDPILDRETWEAVEALLRDPARVTRGGRPAPWLLAGMVKCGRCDQTMVIHYRSKNRGGAREYICMAAPGRASCGKTAVIAEPLEAIIEEVVLLQLVDDRLAKALEAQGGEVQELHQRREVLRAKLREVGEMFDSDEIDRPEYLARRAKLVDRLAAIQQQLDQHAQRSVLVDLPTAEEELRSWWNGSSTAEQKQSVVRACLYSVVVGPSTHRNGPRFDPGRLLPPNGPQWRF